MGKKKGRRNYIWMVVSDDKYEFPLVMADTAKELAELIGTTETSVRSNYCHYLKGDISYCKFRKVEL